MNFRDQFIADFDQLLLDQNNPVINSYELYGQYKDSYLKLTERNWLRYEKIDKELQSLKNYYTHPNEKRHIYKYIDHNKLNKLNLEAKNIVIEQRKHHENFLNFIVNLNKESATSNTVISRPMLLHKSRSKSRSRGLLSKLFPKSKTESKNVSFKITKVETK
jgi:hypothetical protein